MSSVSLNPAHCDTGQDVIGHNQSESMSAKSTDEGIKVLSFFFFLSLSLSLFLSFFLSYTFYVVYFCGIQFYAKHSFHVE